MSAIDPRRGYPAPSGDLSDLPAVPSGPGPGSADVDPFPLTPPSPEESARVVSEAALLIAAADRLERLIAGGSPLPWSYDSYSAIVSGPKVQLYDEWVDTTGGHTLERRGDCPECGDWREPAKLGTPGQGHGCKLRCEDYQRDPVVACVPASAGDTATGAHEVDAELIVALVNAGPALVAWLRNAARDAAEGYGADRFAVAVARQIIGDPR